MSNDDIKERAAAVRDYVSRVLELSPDPGDLYAFSVAVSTWDHMRYRRSKGDPFTVDDDRRFADLTVLCEDLSEKVGLGRALTISTGDRAFLAGSASDRIIDKTWMDAAETWYGG
jgi:hypothetical protein